MSISAVLDGTLRHVLVEEVAATTIPGTLARVLDRVVLQRLHGLEWRLRLAGEEVAERLLTLPAWFTKRVD